MMDKDSEQKTPLAPIIAMLCGLFTAFGCGFILSEPMGNFDAELAEHSDQITQTPEIIPTSYQDVRSGSVQPSQNTVGRMPSKLGPAPEIVVMLKNDKEADRICDIFWKDKAAGRVEFDKLFQDHSELANLRLKRVSYSNEFVVDLDPDKVDANSDLKSEYTDAVKHLKKLQNIAYAEPNATAQPGKN